MSWRVNLHFVFNSDSKLKEKNTQQTLGYYLNSSKSSAEHCEWKHQPIIYEMGVQLLFVSPSTFKQVSRIFERNLFSCRTLAPRFSLFQVNQENISSSSSLYSISSCLHFQWKYIKNSPTSVSKIWFLTMKNVAIQKKSSWIIPNLEHGTWNSSHEIYVARALTNSIESSSFVNQARVWATTQQWQLKWNSVWDVGIEWNALWIVNRWMSSYVRC